MSERVNKKKAFDRSGKVNGNALKLVSRGGGSKRKKRVGRIQRGGGRPGREGIKMGKF